MTVAVIGASSSGLAVLAALRRHGLDIEGLERGTDVGGLWRYQNDNGLSGAYASLRTNVSRPRMQYPSFPMPGSYGDFPGHRDMAEYLFGIQRFPEEHPHSIRCDPHAYRRLLRSDLRRARRAPGSTPHRRRHARELAAGRRW